MWYNFVIWSGVFWFLSRIQSFLSVPLFLLDLFQDIWGFIFATVNHIFISFLFFYMWSHNSSFYHTVYPATLFLHSNFSVDSFESFWWRFISLANKKKEKIYNCQIIFLISFSGHPYSTGQHILSSKSNKVYYPWLVPDFKNEVFSSSLWSLKLSVFTWADEENSILFPSSLRVFIFSHERMFKCITFFHHLLRQSYFSFILVTQWITIHYQMLNYPYSSTINLIMMHYLLL